MIKEVEVFIRKNNTPTTFYECVCDQCGKETGVYPTSNLNYIKERIMKDYDWLEKDGEHFCINCKADYVND